MSTLPIQISSTPITYTVPLTASNNAITALAQYLTNVVTIPTPSLSSAISDITLTIYNSTSAVLQVHYNAI
jgi:hypothetical protein